MATSAWSEGPSEQYRWQLWVAALLLVAGTGARLWLAARTFLNPDEALHYFVATQPSLPQTYTVSLTTAHPPLMFLLLHGWIQLGSSELFLRLPFVAAGMLFGWALFLWVRRIAGEESALFALAMATLAPSLIALSAEVRQYSLLLFFCAACLYALERGVQEDSGRWIALSAVWLWLALLTHYSALIFAAAAGVYGLLRLFGAKRLSIRTKYVWAAGQLLALGICAVLFVTQVSKLRQSGVPSEIAATWLSQSTFHPGQDHVVIFAISKTVRLFRYFFSHGSIGVLMLLLFVAAVVALFWAKTRTQSPRLVAVLLTVPFFIAIAVAIGGLYPYGGTRHDVVLALFAIPGIAMGINVAWRKLGVRGTLALLVLLLVVCNVFASPTPPFIRPKNQQRGLMKDAVRFLNSQPRGSAILADYQGGLVLGYYLCGKESSLPFGPTPRTVVRSRCGDDTLLTYVGSQNSFDVGEMPEVVQQAWTAVPAGVSSLWLFQTGWIDDTPAEWDQILREIGCGEMHNFGANIRVSRCERGLR
jgi:4-amino-4-deoxy-L-arabinose transferase-like glycosyltransferase